MAKSKRSPPVRSAEAKVLRTQLAELKERLAHRRKAEEALRESEARMRALLGTAADGIITIDHRGIVDSFNPAAERIFGYAASDVTGHNVSMLVPMPHHRRHTRYIQERLLSGKPPSGSLGREVKGRRKNGEIFPMELTVSRVRIQDRPVFMGIVRDVSERKRAEQAIASLSERERRRFGRELHDGLGQQLTAVSLLAKSLERQLSQAGQSASHAAQELSELAALALVEVKRQSHGLFPIELERHGLREALAHLASVQETALGISCTFGGDGGEPLPDTAVALHVYRIAQEAIANAVRHGKARHIRMFLGMKGGLMFLRIEDDGVGIPAPAQRGEGLGIFTMRYRANAISGELHLRRRDRVGTVVTCTWPAGDASAAMRPL
jgi:two-component system, LuxR family, sensor kinase FixL